MNKDSLERIVPDILNKNESTGEETLKLHLERYHFAIENSTEGLFLDCACGVGYGSYILAESNKCKKIVAVDVDADAIDYAKNRYAHSKINYIVADATAFSSEVKFDVIVSLETIEHIPDPVEFIKNLKTLLVKGGYLIGSVPTTPSVDANPHHLTDFTEKSFRKIFLELGFEELNSFVQIQKFSFLKIATRSEKRAQNMRKNMFLYYFKNPNAAVKRLISTLKYGFSNRYITIVWKLK